MRSLACKLLTIIVDPFTNDLSSCRLIAVACAAAGIYIALTHPTDAATTVAALIGGGAVAILTRSKSSPIRPE